MLFNKYINKLIKKIYLNINGSGLKNDSNYRLDIVDSCFDNRVNIINNREMFARIVDSYNKAKEVQIKSPRYYQVSNEWLPVYEKYMGSIMSAMKAKDVDKVMGIYNNFMRDNCSVGLHGLPVDMFKHYFSGNITKKYKKLFVEDSLYRFNLWRKSIGKALGVGALDAPLIGNPYGFYIDGKFIRAGADYHHYYATIISRLIRGGGRKSVMELGGGYGGMAYYLMRDNSDITFIDFDLPENLALASFYLMSAFPDKKIALFGEVDLLAEDLKQFDAVMMPNFEIDRISDGSVDLVFNSYSLAEMDSETIANYINNFNRTASKCIFHGNHTRNCLVSADVFGIDTGKFDLLYRAPALWNMARNIDMDEYDYLYKNTNTTIA